MDQERNDDARKAHWRRKMANKALAMADSDLLAMGTLVYLPGEADHDRKVFLQKGVKERNLLCVERKRAIGEQHRGAKKTTVIADLADALMGHDWPISVVWADLCCTLMGRTANAICDAALLSRGVSPATVLMLNVMRARATIRRKAILRGRLFLWARFLMKNVFDRSQYPAREPRSAVARDRWVWRRSDIAALYPTDTYELSYRFTNQADTTDVQEAVATAVDGDYIIEVEASDTELFSAGTWTWEAVILRTADALEAVVDHGTLEVIAAGAASHTLKVLQAIRATIEGTASEDQARIEIGGRVLERRSIRELTDLEALYSRRWKAERAAVDRAAGRPVSRTLIKMGA
jgi:hypothetical protein